MSPLTDLDRELRAAMRVEPSGDFTARIRTRVAAAPPPSRLLAPRFALASLACALLAVVAAGIWRETDTFVAQSVLPYRDLIVLSHAPRVLSSPPQPAHDAVERRTRVRSNATNVVVSRSEMLALQRLFSGLAMAPAQLEAPPEELSIPEIVIEPIAPLVSDPEGEHQ